MSYSPITYMDRPLRVGDKVQFDLYYVSVFGQGPENVVAAVERCGLIKVTSAEMLHVVEVISNAWRVRGIVQSEVTPTELALAIEQEVSKGWSVWNAQTANWQIDVAGVELPKPTVPWSTAVSLVSIAVLVVFVWWIIK